MKYLTKYLLFLSLCGFAAAQLHAQGAANPKSFHKILFLGDSITHSVPGPQIGWTGDWGMAASAADKDYVHLFLAQLAAARIAKGQEAGNPVPPAAPAPEVWIFNEGGGKVTDKVPFVDKISAFHADLAIVQLGENDHQNVTVEGFQQPYEKLLAAIRAGNPNARILCAGVWGLWPTGDQTKNVMVRAACQKYGATFADMSKAFSDPANRVGSENRFTNTAVNWHPGDAGMAAYAKAFWEALASSPVAAAPVSASFSPETKPVEINEAWGEKSLAWAVSPPVVQEEGRNIAKILATGTEGMTFGARLREVTQLRGRDVRVQTRVRAESVSERPKPWNGVKLMFTVRNAGGKPDYLQFKLPEGAFPWTDVDWTVRIPDDAVSLDLIIGLDNVSGTVWFDAIHISTQK
jgi:lysophospholipase L1-like esterase